MKTVDRRTADRETLAQAFLLFEEASGALREEHARLRREVAELRREVEEKNVRLAQGLEEHRRWRLFLAEILDRMPNGIIVTDPSGGVVASNEAAERLMGLARPPQPGEPLGGLSAAAAAVARCTPENGPVVLPVEGGNGVQRKLKAAATPLPDPGGTPGALLLVLEDVTDERLLAERAERERRLASMGEMAARIAHEIRNPLTSCRLFHEMATRDVKDGRKEAALLNLAKLDGVLGTIENTVSNMLGFLRNHRPVAESFDPGRALNECVDQVRPLLSERGIEAEVENRLPGERAVSDPSLLRQAFLNVLLNAVQAMRDSRRRRLKILLLRRFVRKGDREDPYLVFRFEDTGHGIPGDALQRVFDPFFTTRGDGTGLGLTVVQSILLALDGFAEVQSRVGEGTVFSLLVPQFRDAEEARP
jgi:signal transduction histidine kinase